MSNLNSVVSPRIGIDESGRLYVCLEGVKLSQIYREGVGIYWDTDKSAIISTIPLTWSYIEWFQHFVKILEGFKYKIRLHPDIQFVNISDEIEDFIRSELNKGKFD